MNEFIYGAIDLEKKCKKWMVTEIRTCAAIRRGLCLFLKKVKRIRVDNTILKDVFKIIMRDLSLSEDKIQTLRIIIEDLKEKVGEA